MHGFLDFLNALAAFAAVVVLSWAPWLLAAAVAMRRKVYLKRELGIDVPYIEKSTGAWAVATVAAIYGLYYLVNAIFPSVGWWLTKGLPGG